LGLKVSPNPSAQSRPVRIYVRCKLRGTEALESDDERDGRSWKKGGKREAGNSGLNNDNRFQWIRKT